MIKTIELYTNNLARIKEREPFMLPDTLVLDFETTRYDLSNAFVSLKNNNIECQKKLISPFYVDEEFLFPGMLDIAIHIYQDGKCVKSWYCLPLEIMETKHGTMAFEKLDKIEKKLDLINNKFNELGEKHNELADTVSEIKEKIREI